MIHFVIVAGVVFIFMRLRVSCRYFRTLLARSFSSAKCTSWFPLMRKMQLNIKQCIRGNDAMYALIGSPVNFKVLGLCSVML